MIGIVWFKRDLRLEDHASLHAAADGPVLPLYVVEPEYWRGADASWRQWAFTRGAVADLAARLPLVVRQGDAVAVLEALRARHGEVTLYSHEETGNLRTYARDRRVAAWARAQGVVWRQFPQHGVWRGTRDRDRDRDRWSGFHSRLMQATPLPVPALRFTDEPLGVLPELPFPWADDGVIRPQPAGRAAAIALMESFFAGRGAEYRRGMSSPLTAQRVCSRLSPHLALGTISMREALARAGQGGAIPATAIASFASRLHWHCHFIQKLESEPELECRAMHPLMEAARRPTAPDDPLLLAWAEGRTGLPFLDACMLSLRATGWLNFRMRAMVMAVASYHLGLDWQAAGQVLARYFTDYEPGIHWPQVQMQSAATGINTPRIYNPLKQGLDQDPEGRFIARWQPGLAALPAALRHTPWKAGGAAPVIDPAAAAREAKARLTAIRRDPQFAPLARAVYLRHGSRARSFRRDDPKPAPARQLTFQM